MSILGLGGATLLAAATVPQAQWPPQEQRSLEASQAAPRGYAYYFTRAIYSSGAGRRGWGRRGWGGTWSVDYPKADRQFIVGVKHLTGIDAYDLENPVSLDDPELRRFPYLYALEVGGMRMTDAEVDGLRTYLMAGGFLVIDDFWGSWQWANFEQEIGRVLPEYSIVDIPMDHPLLHAFYDIDELLQVPNVRNGQRGGPYWEQDGYEPKLRGIFDDRGRLLVAINWNTDLGDAWEWAENPWYPLDRSNFAYRLGINLIVYGMSH